MRRRSRVALVLALLACVAMPAASFAAPAVAAAAAFPPVNPGGDLSVSVAIPAPASLVSEVASTFLPSALGLPANAPLNEIVEADWAMERGLNVGGSPTPPIPPTFGSSQGTITVTETTTVTTTATVTVTASAVPPSTETQALAGLAAAVAGVATQLLSWGLCLAIGEKLGGTTPDGNIENDSPLNSNCLAISFSAWTIAAFAVNDAMLGITLGGGVLAGIFIYALVNLGYGKALPSLTPWMLARNPSMITTVASNTAQLWATLKAWFSGPPGAGAAAAQALQAQAMQLSAGQWARALSVAGLPGQVAAGTITNFALPGGPFCADGYGVAQPFADGQIVAINNCNGNPNQTWTVWPNGNVTDDGLCLTDHDSNPILTSVVELQYCDGSARQEWQPITDLFGRHLLRHLQSGLCLDDPNFNTAAGTQMQVNSCFGNTAEQWNLPGGTEPSSGSSACDIYASNGTPCVAAYSTVRALFSNYAGPLYQVKRASDGTTANIGLLSPGTYVNAGQQDSFCAGTTCTITELFDQSPQGNNLPIEAGDQGANATALPITIHGNKAYGLDVEPGVGYRDDSTHGIAVNGQPEGMYMVASGTHVNAGCCFDFGNVEANNSDNGAGHMDAVNLSRLCELSPCTGSGPWVQADLENDVFPGNGSNPGNLGNSTPFVTAMLKNDGQTTFALQGGDSTSGGLSTLYNGPLPSGYSPMRQEGGIVVGTGGDNSHVDVGSFFEGVMTAGFPSDAADQAVQANILAAGYAGNSGGAPGGGLVAPAGTITMASGKCTDVSGDDTGVNGTIVDLWDCLSGAVDQHWTHNADFTLETLGRCLNISVAQGVGGSGQAVAGDHTTLWDCNGSGVEKWVQQPDGTLRNPPSGLCLDDGGSTANGFQLQVQPCVPGDQAQKFAVNGGNPILHIASGKCVDVSGDDTGVNGTIVDIWDCLRNAADQHWIYNPSAQTLSTLGRCLNISIAQGVGGTGTGVAGDHTTLWDCNGSGVEQWVQQPDGTLRNPPSGLCLYGQSPNGYQLQVQPCNSADPNQQFFAYDGGAGSGGLTGAAGTITMASGKCTDVSGDDTGVNGTIVDLWDCQSGAADQHWTHNADGSLQTLGRCLTISVAQGVGGTGTGVPGDHTTLWDCNGSGAEQWVQQPDGTLINPQSGLCLDDGGSTANGFQLQVQPCVPGDQAQQFAVNGGNPITLDGSLSATLKCIDVSGDDNGGNGTVVDQWDCQANAADQHWVYNRSSQTLRALGRCLNISIAQGVGGTGTGVAGDHTTLWDCNGSGVEQWVAEPDGTLRNPPTGLCLDDGGSTANGFQLQVQPCAAFDQAQAFGVYDAGIPIVQATSGKCVDVSGNDNGVNGTQVDMWDCLPTAADQSWIGTSNHEMMTLGRCLNVSVAQGVGGTGKAVAGDHVTLWDCNGSGVEQWVAGPGGQIINAGSGLCLDDTGNTSNGTQLQVQPCQSGDANQQFFASF